ncbi:phosphatidylserine synthase 2-like [Lytechinus pictus]|uniref:phosphatidylserine synthase 2-like n=1 Tax=Lytechinus pictus TaxID=7653 RepID=UPI0030B9D741
MDRTSPRDGRLDVLQRVRKMVDELEEPLQPQKPFSSREGEEENTRFTSNQTDVYDDGTNTFFWRAHSITVLFGMLAALLYVAVLEDVKFDTAFNTKRGMFACVIAFCSFGMTQAKDGPFKRPHPAIWRFFLCLSVIYELFLVFILFQSVDDARQLISYIDSDLGKELPEKTYAEDCSFYTPGHPEGAFHNFWEKWDIFVLAHVLGWYIKMLMIRDYWLCTILSISFEIMEYTFEHQLNNFGECWWDHWIMDFLVCNGLGIWLGMVTLNYLNIKTYSWRGLYHIPTYGGKLKRMILQFTPYSWTRFEWRPTENLNRWLAVLAICTLWTLSELNTFYLKTVLWIPPPHFINWSRLFILCPVGCVALRETYQYIEDPNCKKFGQQSWVLVAIIFSETLISVKFQFDVITKPFPRPVAIAWLVFFLALVLWTVWRFCIWSPSRWRSTSSPTDPKDTAEDSGRADGQEKAVTRTVKTTKLVSSVTKSSSASSRTVGPDGDGVDNGVENRGSPYATRSKKRVINGKS